MNRLYAVACLALAVGCSRSGLLDEPPADGAPPAPDAAAVDGGADLAQSLAVSGTRLRAVYLHTADGARQFNNWYDSQRRENCEFGRATDSTLRCMPDFGRAGYDASFADAACTQPVQLVTGTACPSLPGYSNQRIGDNCTGVYELRPIGAQLPLTTVYHNPGCVALPVTANQTFYALGPLVAPSELVEGQAAVEPAATRLAFQSTVTADGAKIRTGYEDQQLATGCFAYRAGDGLNRCLPTNPRAQLSGGFADASCQTPAAQVESVCGDPGTAYVWGRSGDVCDQRISVFPPGAPLPTVYALSPQCSPIASNGVSYIGVGAELPPAGFVPISSVEEATPTRLRRRLLDPGSQGPSVFASGAPWHDTLRDLECSFQPAADGVTRCMPTDVRRNPYRGFYHLDAACTQRVTVQPVYGCVPVAAYLYGPNVLSPSTGQCGGPTRMYPIGTLVKPQPQTIYFQPTGHTECQASLVDPGDLVYQLDDEVTPGDFESATLVIE